MLYVGPMTISGGLAAGGCPIPRPPSVRVISLGFASQTPGSPEKLCHPKGCPLTLKDTVPHTPKLALIRVCGFQLREKETRGHS